MTASDNVDLLNIVGEFSCACIQRETDFIKLAMFMTACGLALYFSSDL